MKFKVGDVVYFVKWDGDFRGETGHDPEDFLHRRLVVEKTDDSDCPVRIERVWFKEEELVHEEIYNSPLYKALT